MADISLKDEAQVDGDDRKSQYRILSVDKAVTVLSAFASAQPELSLRDIASSTGLSKATVFRLLATLESRDLVAQNPATGFYRLGSEITALASARARQGDLIYRSIPAMREVHSAINETICLAVRSGDFRIQLHQIESTQKIHRANQTGKRSPLYAGAGNRLLLAAMDDADITEYLERTELIAFTPSTIISMPDLWRLIGESRNTGYAVSYEEIHPNGAAAGAPIRDAAGDVVGVLYVSVPLVRFSEAHRENCIAEVVKGARNISVELGYREEYLKGL